jgi:hypothetical protein
MFKKIQYPQLLSIPVHVFRVTRNFGSKHVKIRGIYAKFGNRKNFNKEIFIKNE